MVRLEEVLADALPGVAPRHVEVVDTGWDSVVLDVDEQWIVRVARNEAAAAYRMEAQLLPLVAAALPLPVPEVVRVGEGWIVHRRVPGVPLGAPTRAHGTQLGDFLAALHALPVEPFRTAGVHQHDPARHTGRFRGQVLPLLDDHERRPAELLLAEYEEVSLDLRAAHRDLGPEHVLHDGDRITGVIDWSDFALAEPAIDLAWPLFGTTAEFVSALSAAYGGVDAQVKRRALVYHAIGPWHEVVYGLATGERRWIESGLLGVRARLRKATGNADTMAK